MGCGGVRGASNKAGGPDLERWGALSSSGTSLPGAELVPYFGLTFKTLLDLSK